MASMDAHSEATFHFGLQPLFSGFGQRLKHTRNLIFSLTNSESRTSKDLNSKP